MYKLKLQDGTEIQNLDINGNNFVSKTKISDTVFENNLKTVEITDVETGETTILRDCEIVHNKRYGNEWFLVIREIPAEKKRNLQLNDDVTSIQEALTEIYEMMLGGM